MQNNLDLKSPTFGINISKNLVKAAHNYYNGVEYSSLKTQMFDKNIKKFKNYGYDEFTIEHKKQLKDGKIQHMLFANNGEIQVPLTSKDVFRKVLDKLQHITKREIYIKIKDYRNKFGE